MDKKFLAKIIATDNEGLQMISACCAGAKLRVSEIKYLQLNKIFLISIERSKLENNEKEYSNTEKYNGRFKKTKCYLINK